MNKENKALLIGLTIGDGYLGKVRAKKKNRKGEEYFCDIYSLVMQHSIKQEEYLKHKAELLHSVLGGKPPKMAKYQTLLKATNKFYTQVKITKAHKYFRVLKKFIYSNDGKKYLSRRVLDFLTPQALALWYMDDGNLKVCHRLKDGTISSISLVINTYCTKEEAQIIIDYFKYKWNIQFNLAFHSRFNRYCIRAGTKEGNKFLALVRPHIVPSMLYKVEPKVKEHEPLAPVKGEDIV